MICKFCGKEFEGRKRKFCSGECRDKYFNDYKKHSIVCLECGNSFKSKDKRTEYCSVICSNKKKHNRIRLIEKKCQVCDKVFTTKANMINHSKFCSEKCYETNRRATQDHDRAQYLKKYRLENINKYKGKYERPKAHEREGWKCRIYIHRCSVCDAMFVSRTKRRKFCSWKCQYINYENNVFDERVCFICCKSFNKKYGKSEHRTVCSDGCHDDLLREHRRNSKKKRELSVSRQFKERVVSNRVYIRDGFRCGICGKKMDMKKSVPHPLAPTIDHIVPISLGGEHSYRNVRSAHFICNSKRSNNSTGNDQLLLFGV